MRDISDLLAAMGRQRDDGPKLLPEAVVMRLRERAALYAASGKGCPFNVGDLVTPRADSACRGSGEPHIVVEVRTPFEPTWLGDHGNGHGARLDTRVLCMASDGSSIAAFWVESWDFEPYTGLGSEG